MSDGVAIIGAGVSGLTSGVVLAESGRPAVLFAAGQGTDTTSAAAAAIWYPYDVEPPNRVMPWALETFELLKELSETDPASGVSMVELRTFTRRRSIAIPDWAVRLGARKLADDELSIGPGATRFRDGFVLPVPLTDTTIYLEYLRQRFLAAGGSIETRRFTALPEVSREFDVIINCSGIGARELVPDDRLEPHRGQVALVPRFKMRFAVVCDDPPLMYAVPRSSDCLFGGTNAVSARREADPAETVAIVQECVRVLGITTPAVIGERVGLRPFRSGGVRLEKTQLSDGRFVIHNYGHGGAGFTLSWGCAREAVSLLVR